MVTTRVLAAGLVSAITLASAAAAAAQTKGRIGAGGSITWNAAAGGNRENAISIGPLVRVNPRPGWRLAPPSNWYNAARKPPGGRPPPCARLKIRPVMAGIGYTFGPE